MSHEPLWVKQIRQREDPFVWHRIGNETLAEDMKRLLAEQAGLRALLAEEVAGRGHTRVFVTSREKMHPTGVALFDEWTEKARALLNRQEPPEV